MQGKPEITVLIVTAIVAALALDWGNDHTRRILRAAATPAATPVTDPEPVGAELPRSVVLAGELQRQLNAPGVVAGEAALLFKNTLGYQRFLSRRDQPGISVIDRVGPLFAVRVRIGDYHALAAELLVHGADYDQAAAIALPLRPASAADPSPDAGAAILAGADASGARVSSVAAGDVFALAKAIVAEVDASRARSLVIDAPPDCARSVLVARALAYAAARRVAATVAPAGAASAQPAAR